MRAALQLRTVLENEPEEEVMAVAMMVDNPNGSLITDHTLAVFPPQFR